MMEGEKSMQCIKCRADLPDGAVYCPACGKKQTPQQRKALKRPNGTGTVYKLSGRRKRPWVASKARVVIGYYEAKTEALQALERVSEQTITDKYNMTFAEVYDAWSKEHFSKIKEGAQRQHKASYKAFSALHNRKFRSLRASDFQPVLDAHKDTPETLKKYRQLINQMSGWAMREDITTKNYVKYVELVSKPKKARDKFTDEEYQKIKDDSSETAKIVVMMLSTGVRPNELFKLELKDYHETYIVTGSKTEAGMNRTIPINPDGREAFKYFADRATDSLLLSGYEGNKLVSNFRKRDYTRLLERLGIPYKVPYTARHTYGSRSVKGGMAPENLKQIMGHTDYTTTVNNYIIADVDELIAAAESASVTNTLLTNEKRSKNLSSKSSNNNQKSPEP